MVTLAEVLCDNEVSVRDSTHPLTLDGEDDQRKLLFIGCGDGLIPVRGVLGRVMNRMKVDVHRNAGAILDDYTVYSILFLVEHHPIELVLYAPHMEWCGAEHYAHTPEGENSMLARLIRDRVPRFLMLRKEVERLYGVKLKAKGRAPISVEWVDMHCDGLLVPRNI